MGLPLEGPEMLIGRTIGGYLLERVLGPGATGAVFLARRIVAPFDEVAIKLLAVSWQMTAEERKKFRERFRLEAEVLSRLHHPHILSITTYGEEDDVPFMVLPYLSGGTLAMRLATSLLSLAECQRILFELASALDYAHSQKVIHRDIKPSNILLDVQGATYLTDFSIAHLQEASREKKTTTGKMPGTPEYMSPEQGRGENVGPAADIYSLGVVLFEMVTGRVPFLGVAVADLMVKHLIEPPPAPRQFRPELPVPAETAILRVLAKEPDQRFVSAMDLARAFAAGLQGQTSQFLGITNIANGGIGEPTRTAAPPVPLYDQPSGQRSAYPNPYATPDAPPVLVLPVNRRGSLARKLVVASGIMLPALGIIALLLSLLFTHKGSTPIIAIVATKTLLPTQVHAHPTATSASARPTSTHTPVQSTATPVDIAPTATSFQLAPTATSVQSVPTDTPPPVPTDTPPPPAPTDTPIPPTPTPVSGTLLGGLNNLDGYCQSQGFVKASLDGTTAYDWHCDDATGKLFNIWMDSACQWTYNQVNSVARTNDIANPYSWFCYIK